MRLLVCTLAAAWFALGAPGDPAAFAGSLRPDPGPGAHRRAVVDWTYRYFTFTKVGHKRVRCTVYPNGGRVCVLVRP